MFARPALVTRIALQASLGLSLCGMGLASAQQPRLSAGALFESSRQVAVDQAQQAESGVAAQVSKALPAAAMSPAVGLRGLPDRLPLAPLPAVGREPEPMRADKAVDVVDADSSFSTSRSSS